MSVIFIYIIKIIAIQAVLYLFYSLLFHKSGRHGYNRLFILLSVASSFAIPFLELPTTAVVDSISEVEEVIWHEVTNFEENSQDLIAVKATSTSNYTFDIILLLSLLGGLLLVMRLFNSHFQISKFKKTSDLIYTKDYRIYKGEISEVFSYFRSIFMPNKIFESSDFDTILQHEIAHVRMRHSYDRLFIEALTAIFWFNPILYLFKARLIEIHEFQADEKVIITQDDSIKYQEVLFQQIYTQCAVATANYFKLNTIKTRIKMINKSKKLAKWHYLFILPAIALIIFSFAEKSRTTDLSSLESGVNEVLESTENLISNYKPSILPLKNPSGIKMHSGIGERLHPLTKEIVFHSGIDLNAGMGDLIIAPADGMIKKAATIGAHGKKIIIEHGGKYITAYSHLSDIKVTEGQQVEKGQVIGASGNTGMSTGPHLHYEVRTATGEVLNPLDYIQDYDFKSTSSLTKSASQAIRVVLDPGHGGNDEGMKSNGMTEKEIAVKVAKQVANRFGGSKEVEIILTRSEDIEKSLKERVELSEGADLFISLHIESHENKEEDFMLAIYHDENEYSERSKKFSEFLNQEFSGINKNFKLGYSTGYYVLKNAKSPAVMFNMGYFSNPESEQYLNSAEGIKEIAEQLGEAIEKSL